MGKLGRACLAAALAIAVTGCVHTNATRLGAISTERAPVLPQDVSLYRFASQVPGQYEEVALLNSTGDSGFTNEAHMFESMRKAAAKVGANAVILDAISEPGAGAKVAAAIFGVSAQRKGKALAIWVLPGTAAAPAASMPGSATAPAVPAESCASCATIGKGM